jgi:hypothetical protein
MMPIDEAASVPPIRYRQKFGMSVRPELVPPPSALHRAGRDGVSLPPDVERMFKNAKSFLERATIDGWLIQSRRPSRHLSSAWADDPHEKDSEASFAAQ